MATTVSVKLQSENVKNFSYLEPLLPVVNQPCEETSTSTITATTMAKTFLRLTTIFLICSVAVLLTFSVAPRKPIFKVNSLLVSNFTVTKTKLAAIWVADFTVENPNKASELSFKRIESMVFYKENDALAITSVEGFDSNLSLENEVKIKFETTGYEGDQPMVEYPVLREIEEDRVSGTVCFSIRLSVRATYETGNYWFKWKRRMHLNPYCYDLNVRVEGDNGNLIGDGNRYCDVVVLDINSDKL